MSGLAKELDWKNLAFHYLHTNGFIRVDYADGAWGAPVVQTDPNISLDVAANCLHYGQSCFEGLKAFGMKGGGIGLFRPEMNARRMLYSADRICMAAPSEELFVTACRMAVQINREFVPPYGSGASLYVRPLLIGTEPMVGINSSKTYSFFVLVTPVGPYYKTGFFPVEAIVIDEYDRAAPLGTGQAKIGGNYAASLKPTYVAKKQGYPIVLFTDPREHRYVDEFGTSNFIAITRSGEYVTPDSTSILGSITNDSLKTLAQEMGLSVVKRPIPLEELPQLVEVGACGTAAVITPIYAIHYRDKKYTFGQPDKSGEILTKLYQRLQGIQYGEYEDKYGWLTEVS